MPGERNMEWATIVRFLDEAKAAIYFALLGVSLILNIWQYLIKPYRPKEFLSGRWKGNLSAEGDSEVKIVVTLFKDNGELSGFVLYDGLNQNKEKIRGVDRLTNNSDRIHFKRYWHPRYFVNLGKYPLFVNLFVAKMSQDFHAIGNEINESTIGTLYEYQFEVIRRAVFGRGQPRMRVRVATRGKRDEAPSELTGQIYKVKGG
jgi:hypothetical protein